VLLLGADVVCVVCLCTAFLTLSFILLHTFWGIIYFDGCRRRRYYQPVIVIILHMALSCLVSHLLVHTLQVTQWRRVGRVSMFAVSHVTVTLPEPLS